MQAMHMITVFDPEHGPTPLAGSSANTIRKFDGKYGGIQLGDAVVMNHTDDVTTRDAIPLTEILRVSAYAIGTLKVILELHGGYYHNHHIHRDALAEHLLSFYPLPEGQERNPNDPFIALYF
tara:strand:- start:8157 stop:8522 length:366 start_codon:yes stop_codon:yes gene_type:complete